MGSSPNTNRIRIWRFSIGSEPTVGALQVLSDDERARAQRFHRDLNRNQWIESRFQLRTALAADVGLPAAEICFGYGASGKPFLQNCGVGSPEFNLTHAGDVVLIAISDGPPVGVDVERVRELPNMDSTAQYAFAAGEYRQFIATDQSERAKCFFDCWTRKEAVLKAFGTGLSGLKQLDLYAADVVRVEATTQCTNEGGWQVQSLDLPGEYVGAVAVVGSMNPFEVTYVEC